MTQFRRVRAGTTYRFDPVLIDRTDPPWGVKDGRLGKGDLVKVVKLPGCPPPNSMGMAHIEVDGKFAGLVCTNSLQPVT
jgi:hypothetical protein